MSFEMSLKRRFLIQFLSDAEGSNLPKELGASLVIQEAPKLLANFSPRVIGGHVMPTCFRGIELQKVSTLISAFFLVFRFERATIFTHRVEAISKCAGRFVFCFYPKPTFHNRDLQQHL